MPKEMIKPPAVQELDFETILRLEQPELKIALAQHLTQAGYKPVEHKGYLYAAGDIPVMLVAHLDTVHPQPVKYICYTEDGKVAMSPQGIGGDDRCGVWMILEIIRSARCHILFCEDEERGCQGAQWFCRSSIRPQLNYIIELDRRGYNDAVFYQCENEAFERFICGFGFEKQYGTCSDISYIAPHLGVAAVNISSGYYCEHQRHEYIRIDQMEKTAERVAAMVQAPSEAFKYMERPYMMPLRRQSARYDLSGGAWDSMAAGMNGDRCLAMALPADACVKVHGFRVSEGEYLLDGKENLLRYIPELDAAVCVEQGQAYDAQGNKFRFELDDLRRVRVIPVAEALELLQAVH